MFTLGILWGHVSQYIWAEPAEWLTRPQPHSLIPYCVTHTELGFCYFWIYFFPTCMMQSRGSFFMPKQNLYFWIKIEWWWFYYFYCNNHYCHNSEPLSPCKVPDTLCVLHALHYLMAWNKSISQKLSSQVQHWGVCVKRPGHRSHTPCIAQALPFELRASGAFPPMHTCWHLGRPSWTSRTTTFKTWCWCPTKATADMVVVNKLIISVTRSAVGWSPWCY